MIARITSPQVGAWGVDTALLFPPIALAVLLAKGHYRRRVHTSAIDDLARILGATSLAAIALIAAAALLEPIWTPSSVVSRAWFIGSVLLAGFHAAFLWARRRMYARGVLARRTLIVGAGVIGADLERRIEQRPELGLDLVGYLDREPHRQIDSRRAPVLGEPEDLRRVAAETGVDHVVLGYAACPDRMLIPLMSECEALGLEVSLVPRLFERINLRVEVDQIGGLPVYGMRFVNPQGWQFAVKHLIDRVAASLMLVALAPLMLAIATAVKLSSPGPVCFKQRRIGRDGRDFEMLKFRSMWLDDQNPERGAAVLAPGAAPGGVEGRDRRTRVGRFLRKSSLDELPQLINVARGEMSLVGPRPERPEFVGVFARYVRRYPDRHRVKSGITGWAQVNGLRGQTSLSDRIQADNYYIENWSLFLDLKILLMTAAALIQRSE
jgi:exopolysaccharide biosynthesis polyprenyl glycosylphosphotransferase